jgi:hypothetical protein
VLKHATLFFSRSTPNLAKVIPVMDVINDRLTVKANDRSLSLAIRSSLGLAKKTLNRYYSRTDDSEAYRIAMSTFSTCILFFNFAKGINALKLVSLTPSVQTRLLQKCEMGNGVGRHG